MSSGWTATVGRGLEPRITRDAPKQIANLTTVHAGYAASRISSNLKGRTKQFGWLQASATRRFFLSTVSRCPATIKIDTPSYSAASKILLGCLSIGGYMDVVPVTGH
jgi:hypothetical protein